MAFAWFARAITGGAVAWSSDAAAAAVLDDEAPCIFFANHTSHADMVLVWSSLPCSLRKRTRPVAAADYWKGGPLRRHFGIGVFRSVLVERGCVPGTVIEAAPRRGRDEVVPRGVDPRADGVTAGSRDEAMDVSPPGIAATRPPDSPHEAQAVPAPAAPAFGAAAATTATTSEQAVPAPAAVATVVPSEQAVPTAPERAPMTSVGGDHPDPREVPAAVQCMVDALDAGDSLILFPEGTRGDGIEIAKFKSGLYHLAVSRPDVRLIPIHLANLNKVLPKGEIVPIPFLSRMTVGEPQRLQPGEDRRAFLDRMRAQVEALADS